MTQRLLIDADDAWSEGRMQQALQLYAHDSSWHAAFQAAWIRAAFAPLPDADLARLRRPDLTPEARDLLETLVDRVQDRQPGELLEGAVRDWDIETLAGNPKAGDRMWWEQCADLAIETGQWGLAQACFDAAAEISPEMYYDPPRRSQGIQAQLETHLDIVRAGIIGS